LRGRKIGQAADCSKRKREGGTGPSSAEVEKAKRSRSEARKKKQNRPSKFQPIVRIDERFVFSICFLKITYLNFI
jgi:hypothetical protein